MSPSPLRQERTSLSIGGNEVLNRRGLRGVDCRRLGKGNARDVVLMIRYGTQVNKALTSAMILWAICTSSSFSSLNLHLLALFILPPLPRYHLQTSLPSVPLTSLGIQLINSNHLPILHCHLHPTLIIRTSIKGIEVYRKFPILSLLLRESFSSFSLCSLLSYSPSHP